DEAPKIDKVVKLITTELNAFRRMLGNDEARLETLKLYVAGMTDRVGSEADNRVLSQKRAQAIARYFKRKGIEAPVFYAGFGERNRAVETADDVAEPLNRRAMYILSNATPTRLGAANWRPAK
ncbi:MAG TPA: OmpA family protein, partial [Sphingomonas sanguinis]|uniref:OmpA family protein n=1 Tax=Sphingomonas sanguinis TaxID=33051 RepID=UPI002ABFE06E|nr:OmpA family protein [Sphingomonas sanguinis]